MSKGDNFTLSMVLLNETKQKEFQVFKQVNLAAIDANIMTIAACHAFGALGLAQAQEAGEDPEKIAQLAAMLGIDATKK